MLVRQLEAILVQHSRYLETLESCRTSEQPVEEALGVGRLLGTSDPLELTHRGSARHGEEQHVAAVVTHWHGLEDEQRRQLRKQWLHVLAERQQNAEGIFRRVSARPALAGEVTGDDGVHRCIDEHIQLGTSIAIAQLEDGQVAAPFDRYGHLSAEEAASGQRAVA